MSVAVTNSQLSNGADTFLIQIKFGITSNEAKDVLPALVTPFDQNGNIDFKAFEKHMTESRDAGVTGWVANGPTGKFFSQATGERRAVLQFI